MGKGCGVGPCELCGRTQPRTFHHLIPRTLHSNKWFKKSFTREQMAAGLELCRDCHGAIHTHIDEKRLGRELNSRERLLAHPQIDRFVAWLSRQRAGRRFRSRAGR